MQRQFPRQRVAVEAHTDTSSMAGATAYQVANAQAQTVMDYLMQRGNIPAQRLSIVAQGPNHPIADNNTPAGRAENRRIELVIYPSLSKARVLLGLDCKLRCTGWHTLQCQSAIESKTAPSSSSPYSAQ